MCYNKSKLGKIYSPKLDVVFKSLFGEVNNTKILEAFLKSILDIPASDYESIQIVDPHLFGEYPEDKRGIVDLRIIMKSGKIIQVELQAQSTVDMVERITFYNNRIFTSQLKSGKDYDELNKVISILIVDFKMIADCQNYYHKFMMLGDECGSRHMILNEIHVLELPKLPKNSDGSKRYDWLTFIDWEKEETIEMIVEKDENIKEAYVTLKRLSLDEEKQYIFEAREKAQRDERAREKFIRREAQQKSREEGLKEGREEGRKEGREEGRKEGREEGRKEGQEEMKIEVAKKLVTNGLSIEVITAATGLSESFVKQLQEENKQGL